MIKKYTEDVDQRFKEALTALPEPPKKFSRKQLIESAEKEIRAARDLGYTYEQIQECAQGIGFDIGLPTLKEYYRTQSKKRKRSGRKRTVRSEAGSESTAVPDAGAVVDQADGEEEYTVKGKTW